MSRIDTRDLLNEWEVYAKRVEAKYQKLQAKCAELEANQIKGRCETCWEWYSTRTLPKIGKRYCAGTQSYRAGCEYCSRWGGEQMTTLKIQLAPCDTRCDRCEGLICLHEQTVMVEDGVIPERFCVGCALESLPSFVPEAENV